MMSKTNRKGHAKTNPHNDNGRCNTSIMTLWQNNAIAADVNKPNVKPLPNRSEYDRKYLGILKIWCRAEATTSAQETQTFLSCIIKKSLARLGEAWRGLVNLI